MDRIDKWDVMQVICVKAINGLKPGNIYNVVGRGSLEFNYAPEARGKKGWGLCIEQEIYENWKSTKYSDRIRHHYFNMDELEKYFVVDENDYIVNYRDAKINSIIGD